LALTTLPHQLRRCCVGGAAVVLVLPVLPVLPVLLVLF
jgi:hypothetical protein